MHIVAILDSQALASEFWLPSTKTGLAESSHGKVQKTLRGICVADVCVHIFGWNILGYGFWEEGKRASARTQTRIDKRQARGKPSYSFFL